MDAEELRRVMARVRGEEAAEPERVETPADRLQQAVTLSGRTMAAGEALYDRSFHCRMAAGGMLLQPRKRHQQAQTELFLLGRGMHSPEKKRDTESILRLLRRWCSALQAERETYDAFAERKEGDRELWQGFAAQCRREEQTARALLQQAVGK